MIEFINDLTGLSPNIQIKLFISFSLIFSLLLLKKLIDLIIWKKTEDAKLRYFWSKTISYITIFLIVIILGNIWFKGFKNIDTFLGLFSAGLAIALKDLLINISGWFFIIVRRPFTVGDRVQIDSTSGDVIDIRSFQFTLLEIGNWVDADQSTGRIIHIPNGKIFTDSIANYTQSFAYIWDEIPILIIFESNWKKAKDLLTKIANTHVSAFSKFAEQRIKRASRKYMIFYNKLDPVVYTSVKDSGVMMTIRFLCNPKNRRDLQHKIWESVLDSFSNENDIDFAYPTQRFYNNFTEGKDKTGFSDRTRQ